MKTSSYTNKTRTNLYLILMGGILLFFVNYSLYASECKTQAELVSEFYLCESSYTGNIKLYSCRDYRHGDTLLRVYYKGGKTPKAIATINKKSNTTEFNVADKKNHPLMVCNITPPKTMPRDVSYMGTGVCENDKQESIPCSLFKYASARNTEIYHYHVFYNNNKSLHIDKLLTGNNIENAMTAELAYQIGLQLIKSNCCRKRALEYISHAYKLFPNAEEYRDTYFHYKLKTVF